MKSLLTALAALFLCSAAVAQQDYVPKYDLFLGYSYFESPKLNLAERGFNGEFGVNVNRWLALGVDYSYLTGHSDITPSELLPSIQAQLAPVLPLLGPNPAVPFDSITYTFTAGPQINFRQLKWITFFVRPAIGGIHERATLTPKSPILALVVKQLSPTGKESDLEPFFGAGGGFDINASKHLGIRVGVDVVHTKLFKDLLAEGRNSVRVSIGPTIRFGKNVE